MRSGGRAPALTRVGWSAAGATWAVALLLPWTSRGLLSRASLLDAARFVRGGTLDGVVPPAAALLLVAPAALGLLLVALGGWRGRSVTVARVAAGGIGALAVVLLAWRLTGGDASRLGPGALLALAGVVLAGLCEVAVAILRRTPRRAARSH